MSVNHAFGFEMAKKSAALGGAVDTLALCYEQGFGVERNPSEVLRMLTEDVVEWQDWPAGFDLARCYKDGIDVKPSLEKMAAVYKKGSEYPGSKGANYQEYYGLCLLQGTGVQENKRKGLQMINNSIRLSNSNGCYAKGEYYRYGYGVEPDLSKAVEWYGRASLMRNGIDGKVKSIFALGTMYELGQGGLQLNLVTEFAHFIYAANRIHQEAQWKVAFFCKSAIGTDRSEDRAAYFFRLAANSGHKNSQLKATECYMKGKGVWRDLQTETEMLRQAARNGDRGARRRLQLAQRQN